MVYYVIGTIQTLFKYELSLTAETNVHIFQMKRLRFREIYF